MNDDARRCGNVRNEIEKMTQFVNGLLSSIPTIVARFWESKRRPQPPHGELEQDDQDEEESY